MYQVSFSDKEFQRFFIQHLQRRLSGSSILAIDEIENIRQSVLFVMNHATEGNSPESRFISGKQLLTEKLAKVIEVHRRLKESYQCFGIESMKDTLVELTNFFETYDIDYNATESGSAWIDYQLANPVDDLQYKGIDFVEQYLKRLTIENDFVMEIDSSQVKELLKYYSKQLRFDYRKDINNLYQVVMNQWLAKKIAKSSGATLLVTKPEAAYVYSCLLQHKFPDKQLMLWIEKQPYHKQTFLRFAQRISLLDSVSSLKNILLMEEKEPMELTLEPAMTGREFSQKKESYRLLEDESQQVAFLLKEILSPYDLFEFFEEELIPESFYQWIPFERGLGLILVVNQFKEGMLESWEDIFFLSDCGLKIFVERLDASQKSMITLALEQFTIGERDFS
ncbi:TPA: DUF6179 domain-containing protein [Enterococcus faecium]